MNPSRVSRLITLALIAWVIAPLMAFTIAHFSRHLDPVGALVWMLALCGVLSLSQDAVRDLGWDAVMAVASLFHRR
jgi:hypothetical protein